MLQAPNNVGASLGAPMWSGQGRSTTSTATSPLTSGRYAITSAGPANSQCSDAGTSLTTSKPVSSERNSDNATCCLNRTTSVCEKYPLGIVGVSLDLVSGCEGADVRGEQRRILDRDAVVAQRTEWP